MSFLGLLLPVAGWAEGAVRFFDCTTVQLCDGAGSCEVNSKRVTFEMEPLDVDANGKGDYKVSYEDIQVEMEALSEAGPFFWAPGNERNTLLASSETEFLWHSLEIDQSPDATVRFLSCELRQ